MRGAVGCGVGVVTDLVVGVWVATLVAVVLVVIFLATTPEPGRMSVWPMKI